ncbi:hypothetical protein HDU98_008531 [Podochytrium sp. JEL0797]|nr:hypothetical protein HDU98_008531 [Podochytrium sp. JEL0797]
MQHVLLALAAAAVAVTNAQSIQFPSVCQSACTPFGNALMQSCMVTPTSTDVSITANKIAACFCTQYSSGGGIACATCIGNAPTLAGLNSTTLFTTLVADCAADMTGATAAVVIAPIISAAVIQNVAVATTAAGAKATGSAAVVAAVATSSKSAAGAVGVSVAALVAAVSLLL